MSEHPNVVNMFDVPMHHGIPWGYVEYGRTGRGLENDNQNGGLLSRTPETPTIPCLGWTVDAVQHSHEIE